MDRKKVLHIVSTIGIDSGVMSVIMNMYRNIDTTKVQFDFLYFDEYEKTYEEEIHKLGGCCYRINRPNLSISCKKEIENFFYENGTKYIAIHNHEVYLNIIFSRIAKKYGIKNIIVHSHTTKYSDKKLNSIRNKLLCIPLKFQNNYKFACSKAAGEFLYGKKSIEKNNVYILNNAIDTSKFIYSNIKREEMKKKLKLNDSLVIGHVGRFNEQKNHRFLIDIFLEISKLRDDAKLLLIGNGPLENEIVKKVSELKLNSKVMFLGRREDISDLMQCMDVFLLPSLYEGLPLVAVEAQTIGLPCVISTEITREVELCNTLFIDLSENSKIWAKKILKHIEYFNRKDESDKIKECGFDVDVVSKQIERFYLDLNN